MKIARNFTHSLLLALNVFSKIRWAASRSPNRDGRGGTGQSKYLRDRARKKIGGRGKTAREK